MPAVLEFFNKWGKIILAFLIMALLLIIVINFAVESGLIDIEFPKLW